MLKRFRLFIVFVLLLRFLIVPIQADIGPKPSVEITFENMPEGKYYVTLLTSQDSYGPWQPITEETFLEEDEQEVAKAFLEAIKDKELYCYENIQECSDNHFYSWSYYPPNDFVIAIYFPETKTVLMSNHLERVAFDTYYTVYYKGDQLDSQLTGQSDGPSDEEMEMMLDVREDINNSGKLLNFFLRVIGTIVIEVLIGLLFKYRSKREIRIILITNLITQLLLHGLMYLFDVHMGPLTWVIIFPILELVVFIIELIVYFITMKDHNKWKTFFYTLLANLVTFFIGIGLALMMV